ncbi:hypothetical protein [Arthrobacter sp.]|uniref:hypothetical protein n=1 Tax=Arthrobacter sp. TaxID=1667 RepID=UPI003A90F89C
MQRRIAGSLAVLTVALATACTASPLPVPDDPVHGSVPPTHGARASTGGSSGGPLGDQGLSDPQVDYWAAMQADGAEIDRLPAPLVHQRGTGPAGFRIPALDPTESSGLRIYVTCSAGADFRATFGTFHAGTCLPDGATGATLPLGAETGILTLDLPQEAEYWLLVVPS